MISNTKCFLGLSKFQHSRTQEQRSPLILYQLTPPIPYLSLLSSLQVMVHRTPFRWVSVSSILSVCVSLAKPLIRLIAAEAGGLAVF